VSPYSDTEIPNLSEEAKSDAYSCVCSVHVVVLMPSLSLVTDRVNTYTLPAFSALSSFSYDPISAVSPNKDTDAPKKSLLDASEACNLVCSVHSVVTRERVKT